MEGLWTISRTFWEMGISSSLLIGAVLAVRMIFLHRFPKRTFSVLWMICTFRALLPVTITSPVNVRALLRRAELLPFVRNASPIDGAERNVLWGTEVWNVDKAGDLVGNAAATGVPPAAGIAAVVWLLGVILLGSYFLMVYVKYRRLFSESLPLEKTVTRENSMLRRVRLRCSDRITAPLSYGLLHPVILFPASMDWEDETAVSMILAHEEVHIRRLDGLMKGLGALNLSLHWWNPMVWILFVLSSRDMELACDEAVILQSDGDLRKAYAMTLIRMEERRGACGVLYSHFSENAIEERITAIMKIRKTTGPVLICALCLVVGLTMVFATDAPEKERTTEISEPVLSEAECLVWPAEDCDQITMPFGERVHPVTGESAVFDHITISASDGEAEGSMIWASASGTVCEAAYHSDYGYYVVIDHGKGLMTKYTHCKELLVNVGQTVKQSEPIASVGATGKVTGPCLGFYVYQDGEAKAPELYLK